MPALHTPISKVPVEQIFSPQHDPMVNIVHELRERSAQVVGKAQNRVVPFRPWAERLPIPGQGSLDFSLFPFQEALYSDEVAYAKEVAIMKATQIGISEWLIRWSMFFTDTRGDTGLYVFPSLRPLRDFSDQRVKPLIQSSDYLRSRVPRGFVDNKLLKQIGFGFLNFRGSRNKTDLISVPADTLAFDEYDDLVQANIPEAEKRLSSPTSRGLIRRIGVPTYTDYGIHAKYEESDQRQWLVKCAACTKELPLAFWQDDEHENHYLDEERLTMACGNCEEPISRVAIGEGRWVARHPGRRTVGFQVSRLMVPTADYEAVVRESKLTKDYEIQTFWRSTLGLPFDPAEGRLSKEALAAAISAGGNYAIGPWDSGYTGERLVTMGVDVASARDLNVRISEHLGRTLKRALWVGTVKSFDDLAIMMQAWRVQLAVLDGSPDGRLSRGFCERFPGRAFWISWGDNQIELMKIDEVDRHVSMRRTELISATLDLVRAQKNWLPVNLPEEYVKHMRSAVLMKEEDDKGRVKVFYAKQGPDDYMQAESYDTAAGEVWWAIMLGDAAQSEVLQPLESMMEFRRSGLGEYDSPTYSPGPTSDENTWSVDSTALDHDGDLEFPDIYGNDDLEF